MAELKILRNIKRGPYVEFNTTGNHWDNSSIFLEEIVFGVFSNIFGNSHKKFIYYGPTEFTKSELISLGENLTKFISILHDIKDIDSFREVSLISAMTENLLKELESENKMDLKSQGNQIVQALKEISSILLELVQNCSKEDKTLWVLGI